MAASFLTILMSEMLKYEQKYLLGMMSFLVWDQILEGFKAKVGNASSSPKRRAGRRPGRDYLAWWQNPPWAEELCFLILPQIAYSQGHAALALGASVFSPVFYKDGRTCPLCLSKLLT